MNPFQILALSPQLTLTEHQIKEAYNQVNKTEETLQARNFLLNPVSRLEQWMSLNNIEIDRHASIPADFIEVFSQISECVNTVGQLSVKKEKATSLLAQTLLDKKLFEQKPKIDQLVQVLNALKDQRLSELIKLQKSFNPEQANIILQNLKFIQKWSAALDKSYTLLL